MAFYPRVEILKRTLCGGETWKLWKVDQKYLGSFEMWYWRRLEKISWAVHVENEEVLHRVKDGVTYIK